MPFLRLPPCLPDRKERMRSARHTSLKLVRAGAVPCKRSGFCVAGLARTVVRGVLASALLARAVLVADQKRFRDASIAGVDVGEVPPRPIALIKTHKTGSTTLANIVFRLGEARRQRFLLNCTSSSEGPRCGSHLGWPGPFPPAGAEAMWGAPRHQFDILCNHAVYNDARMRGYLGPKPFFFTLLREPGARLQSAFAFFPGLARPGGWAARAAKLEALEPGSRGAARLRNSQAHDLGWYEWAGSATQDENVDLISAWIGKLDRNLSLVILTEYFDEGLVLLRRRLDLALDDVSYARVEPEEGAARHEAAATAATASPALPAAPEGALAAALARHGRVDSLLYEHFNRSFWQEWEVAGGWEALGPDLTSLREKNKALAQACREAEVTEGSILPSEAGACSWRFRANDVHYPMALAARRA